MSIYTELSGITSKAENRVNFSPDSPSDRFNHKYILKDNNEKYCQCPESL